MTPGNGGNAQQMLRDFVGELDEIARRKAELKADENAIWLRVKLRGFSKNVVKAVIKEREQGQVAVEEFEALKDIYRMALGMKRGRPLSDDARRRLDDPPKPPSPPENPEADDEAAKPETPPPPAQAELPETKSAPIDEAAVREEGRQAFRDGKRVLDNPYVAGDPRRGFWDEGWCLEAGSDGMDIPSAYRPNPKPKKPKDPKDPPDDGEGGAPPSDGGGDAGNGGASA